MDYPIDCLLLAGGTPDRGHPLYAHTSGGPKALLEIAGRPMVQWVLDALTGSKRIGRIVLVGSLGEVELECANELVHEPGGGDWSDSFFAGVERLDRPPGRLAAFCWSDIPLLEGAMVDRFLDGLGETPTRSHAASMSSRIRKWASMSMARRTSRSAARFWALAMM